MAGNSAYPKSVATEEKGESSAGSSDLSHRLVIRRTRPETMKFEQELLDIISHTAATINHEINNPLMSILATVEILLGAADQYSPEVTEKIQRIGLEAERIRDVIEKLIDIEYLRLRRTDGGKLINLNISSDSRSHPADY